MATRLAGSSDLYEHAGRPPFCSINFVTSHDGFTINDLVSYKDKHNLANGEDNRDGDNHNISDNYGVEGPTRKKGVNTIRSRQIRNMFATLLLSQGVPMIVSGDEVRRTAKGNNNAYCQDNDLSWFDWKLVDKHADMLRFVRGLIHFRLNQPTVRRVRASDRTACRRTIDSRRLLVRRRRFTAGLEPTTPQHGRLHFGSQSQCRPGRPRARRRDDVQQHR